MQIQWINSANRAFGFTIEFVRGGLRQRESNREVLCFTRPNFALSVFEKLSRCGVNALSDVEHLGLLVDKEALADRLLVHFVTLNSLVAEYFQEIDVMVGDSKEEFADYLDGDGGGVWLAFASEEPIGCMVLRGLSSPTASGERAAEVLRTEHKL